MYVQELGRRLRERRKTMRITQHTLAQQAKMSRNYLSLLEQGKVDDISLGLLSRLALALDTTPVHLLGWIPDESIVISSTLYKFATEANLGLRVVEAMARLPAPERQPATVEGWRELYDAIRDFVV